MRENSGIISDMDLVYSNSTKFKFIEESGRPTSSQAREKLEILQSLIKEKAKSASRP